ncbi:MAG: ribokinase, partial [Clostridia bacterium]|nr:ribokinase [Clostridia bacterium]
MSKITVVGSFVMDNVAKMDRFPAEGESIIGKSIDFFPGGKGANQCVSIARLGGDVAMAGMLGKDSNGERFRKILKDEGIDSKYVFSCDRPTAIAQIQINAAGQNRICVIPEANFEFKSEQLEAIDELLRTSEIVIFQLEMDFDTTLEAIKRAHNYGAKVLLNPAPARGLPDDIYSNVDYITPNETELSALTGMPTNTIDEIESAARNLYEKGVGNVIATIGSRGAFIYNNETCEVVPTYDLKPIDTVAAGDSFNGALAVGLSEGKSLHDAVVFANAMGSLT